MRCVAHVPDSAGRSQQRYLRFVARNDCLNTLYNDPMTPRDLDAARALRALFPDAPRLADSRSLGLGVAAARAGRRSPGRPSRKRRPVSRRTIGDLADAATDGDGVRGACGRRGWTSPVAERTRRLLTIGHSYVVASNRRLAHEMALQGSGRWQVTAVAPARFRGDMRRDRARADRRRGLTLRPCVDPRSIEVRT